jgi:hypothetical protein
MLEEQAGGVDYVGSAAGSGIGEAGEADVEERRPVFGAAGR